MSNNQSRIIAKQLAVALEWFNGDGESLVYQAILEWAKDGDYDAEHIAKYACESIANRLRKELLDAITADETERSQELEDAIAKSGDECSDGAGASSDRNVEIMGVRAALDAYRIAVTAEARAALLANAPTVWVVTDANGESGIYAARPSPCGNLVPGKYFVGAVYQRELTSPGTCVRYRLVPDPEGSC